MDMFEDCLGHVRRGKHCEDSCDVLSIGHSRMIKCLLDPFLCEVREGSQ